MVFWESNFTIDFKTFKTYFLLSTQGSKNVHVYAAVLTVARTGKNLAAPQNGHWWLNHGMYYGILCNDEKG